MARTRKSTRKASTRRMSAIRLADGSLHKWRNKAPRVRTFLVAVRVEVPAFDTPGDVETVFRHWFTALRWRVPEVTVTEA